jgi:hypothetical protein
MNYDPPKARLEDADAEAYRDPTALSQWTQWSLYALIVINVFAIVAALVLRSLLLEPGFGLETTADQQSRAESADQRSMLIAAAQLVTFVVSGILCLVWIHRMAFNSRIRARYAEYTPGWAVGWYFIPIALWWKPYQAMKEIWKNSAEQAGPRGEEPRGLLGWWWTLWILVTQVSNAAFRTSLNADTVEGLVTSTTVAVVGDVIQIPLCIVFILIVKRLTAMQEYAHDNPLPQAQDLRAL